MTFRLLPFPAIGQSRHRSGWPYAMRYLRRQAKDRSSVILDDYVERTFLVDAYQQFGIVHRGPWVAICHHPPDLPKWYNRERLQNLQHNSRWLASFQSLRLVICLGDNLTSWVEQNWRKPCVTIKHPSSTPRKYWSVKNFQRNTSKRLVQIGSFLRYTQAIDYVRCPKFLKKTKLVQPRPEAEKADKVFKLKHGQTSRSGTVDEIPRLDAGAYDRLLAENVVFLNLIASVANNTIVECIARNTPVVVNRLPGPLYYLGAEYPLFYDSLEEVPELLANERILSAHRYLKNINKTFLNGSKFAEHVVEACQKYVAECAFTAA